MMRTLIRNNWMKLLSLVCLAGIFALVSFLNAGQVQAYSWNEEEPSWIIRWNESPPEEFHSSSEIIDYDPETNIYLARPASNHDASEWTAYWEHYDGVQYVQANRRLAVSARPNDPMLSSQDYLETIGAIKAWDEATGNTDITIAIVDTGIDLEHPDLSANIVEGVNLLEENQLPQDDNGHGTNIAGVLAAVANNRDGIAGLLWDARIMPIKALGADGMGDEHKLGEGIRHAVDNGADIILLALGLHHYSPYLHEVVEYAEEQGVLLVAATGNEGGAVKYPAAFPTVLAVGGIDQRNEVMTDSNFGPEIDVVAPWHVYTTQLGGGYGRIEGTSMAAPQAAAAAALIWAKYPDFEPYQIRNLIRQSALDVDAPGWDEHSGYGLLQIQQALTMSYQEDIYEPNDKQTEAARLPVSAGITAVLSGGSDEDWYWLNHRYPGQVKVRIKTHNEQDVHKLRLVYNDEAGNQHIYEDLTEELFIPIQDQKVFIAVMPKRSDQKENIPYEVITDFYMGPDPFEDNDVQYKAYVLPNRDQTIRGTFHQNEDADWFVMYIEQAGTLKVRAYTDTNRMDLELLLQQGNENPRIIDWGADGESEYSGPIDVQPGKYYIRVRNYHPSPVAGYYFLNMEYNQAFTDPNEPNNRSYQATPLIQEVVNEGVIDKETDADWFTFTLEEESAVGIKLTDIPKDRMMSLKLYDAKEKQLSVDVNMLGYDKILLDKILDPGKYYIRLSANQPFNYQMYQLQVSIDEIVSGLRDISGHWAEEWIVDLKENNLMNGYDNGYFNPEQQITRAEAAAVIAHLVSPDITSDPEFSDVNQDHWAYDEIVRVTNAGIFTGYPDGTFQPSKPLTRVEMTILMAHLIGVTPEAADAASPFTDIKDSHWAFAYVYFMEDLDWISGYPDGSFRPNQEATRAEFASFISRAVNTYKEVGS